ncbi:MAG TPA: hypothetical protein PK156_00530 [Polyangium sp.]|nr:hypothetical protein [Polyangium sp.]
MKKNITIPIEEAWRIFELIEELHDFLHQPMNYSNPEDVEAWLAKKDVYPELRHVYYKIVTNWFPVNEETGIVEAPPGVSRRFGDENK